MTNDQESKYRWFIVTLAALTMAFVVAIPEMCMPVLFKEISNDLGLSLVQLGTVWGMIGLGGVFTCIAGGLIGDRFGTKRTISVACILAGIAGASRGLSGSFMGLTATMFIFGILVMTLTLNIHKSAGVWFSGRQVVIANGIVATGIALGFMAGAMISDTIMSPLLGGWKNVLFFYGAVSIIMGLIWIMTRRESAHGGITHPANGEPFCRTLARVVRIRNVWFLALGNLFYSGCLMGLTGYLPLYLREIGWKAASADGALAVFNGAGMVAAIPLTLLSGRLGSRKMILVPSLIIAVISVGLLSVAEGSIIWLLVILIGLGRDAYYAIITTMIIETEGVGAAYAGTAIGIVWTVGNLGGFIGPPVGNILAGFYPGSAFIFWSVLVLASVLIFRQTEETGQGKKFAC